jgi:molybdopterin converting factor small subunit
MATIRFTANLARHREVEVIEAQGETVRALIDDAMRDDPILQSYVLDEQGRVRKHVNIFVDGAMIADRLRLSDPVRDGAEVYVMQALSGG